MIERVWVVKLEYETGSENGEVVQLLSAHTSQSGARAAVRDWQRAHGCPVPEGYDWTEFWCPVCHWGADYEDVAVVGK